MSTRLRILLHAFLATILSSTSVLAYEKADLVKLMSSNQCTNCDLTMADLRDKDLKGANLESADLFGADLSYSDLSGANLTGSILIGANLKKTNLENAKIDNADLRVVDLTSSKIKNVNLDNVIFCRTETPWTKGGIDRDCNRGVIDKWFTDKYEAKTIGEGFYIGGLKISRRHGIGVYSVPSVYRYIGHWKKGNKHGMGSIAYSNGDHFNGDFKEDNLWEGKGKVSESDGRTYKGEFKNGNWHGNGRYSWPNGDEYIGEWMDGKRHGEGVATFSSGHRYVGKWMNDESSGHFRVTYPSGGEYNGNVLGGSRHGQGTLSYSDGTKYIGSWKNDDRHGKGTYTWPSGQKYIGEWVGNIRNGYGILTVPGGIKYAGEWKDGKEHGRGKATHYDGRIEDGEWKLGEYVGEWKEENTRVEPNEDGGSENDFDVSLIEDRSGNVKEQKYEGDLRDGRPHGKGKMFYESGNSYDGEWKDGKKHGWGEAILVGGSNFLEVKDKYVGEFKDGLFHGKGTFYWPTEGRKYVGDYKNGKQHGKGKMTHNDGRIEDGEWRSGEYVGEWNVAELTGVRASQSNTDHTRVIFDLSGEVEHSLFTLESPDRVVIDLKDVHKHAALISEQHSTELLKGIRSVVRKDDDLRIVLDLNSRARPRSFILQPDGQQGYRLVVDMHATNLTTKTSPQERRIKKEEFVITIDPGHGGKDTGSVGQKGTQEKDVTLAIGKKLENIINSTPGLRAVLTRESDHHVEQRKRVEIARQHQSDIFVSLHTEDLNDTHCEGASVYAISLNGASSEAARMISEKENAPDLLVGGEIIRIDDKDLLIASVLLDLAQTATIQDSLELGSEILNHLGKVGKLNENVVQQADYEELRAPDMPSIYINIACISNAEEERRLNLSSQQQNIANAIFAGVNSHLERQ